jgi:hypothetical protein
MGHEFLIPRPYYILGGSKHFSPSIKEDASLCFPETFEVLKAVLLKIQSSGTLRWWLNESSMWLHLWSVHSQVPQEQLRLQ